MSRWQQKNRGGRAAVGGKKEYSDRLRKCRPSLKVISERSPFLQQEGTSKTRWNSQKSHVSARETFAAKAPKDPSAKKLLQKKRSLGATEYWERTGKRLDKFAYREHATGRSQTGRGTLKIMGEFGLGDSTTYLAKTSFLNEVTRHETSWTKGKNPMGGKGLPLPVCHISPRLARGLHTRRKRTAERTSMWDCSLTGALKVKRKSGGETKFLFPDPRRPHEKTARTG